MTGYTLKMILLMKTKIFLYPELGSSVFLGEEIRKREWLLIWILTKF